MIETISSSKARINYRVNRQGCWARTEETILALSVAGLAPSVWQSGETCRHGGVTKQGSPPLRSVLVQAGHVLLFRCTDQNAAPLRAIAMRVHKTRTKRKIAVVAAARHILRIAFYVLRDQRDYNPALLRSATIEDKQAVA